MTKPVAMFRSGVIGDPRHTIRLDENSHLVLFSSFSFQPVYHLMGDIQGAQGEEKKTPAEVGGCFFGEFPAQKSTFSCFVFSRRTSWLCLCVVGQETPEVSYPTDLSNGYKTGPECRKTASARGIGSKWPNMGLQHATYAWEVC
jgi:hypothetical protein